MTAAVATGRIDTVHSAHTPEAMGRPPRVDRHGGEVYVYRRPGQPCLVCATPVRQAALAGRHSYWCAHCQPVH
jgi:endonuclease-8